MAEVALDPLGVPVVKPLNRKEFKRIQEMMYGQFGLDLRPGKEDLVAARLGKRIRELKLCTFSQYLDFVQQDKEGSALTEMVDLLTTNFTSFFREQAHFDFCGKVLPDLYKRNGRVRIWSAACSSGEEPYSIAILAAERIGAGKVEILATDISSRVLEKAKSGVYPADRLSGIPQDLLRRYFLRGQANSAGLFRAKSMLTDQITFRRLNLLDPYSQEFQFSIIWCRNVMIYFDKPTQEKVVNKLSHCLHPGGYLFIGHSEALNGLQHPFEYVQPAIYRKREHR